MKVAIWCDTHYGIRNDNHVFYEYQKKSNEYFFGKLDQLGVKTSIHLGDLTDRRKYLNYVTGQRVKQDLLDPLGSYDSHIICGNHDVYYKNTNAVNSLEALVDQHHKTYIDPTEIDIGGYKICLLPWINADNIEASTKLIRNTKAEICLGHLEISGFEMHTGAVCDHGLEYSLFEKFDVVGSGHFHHRSSYGPVHYLGAAYEFTWSDFNDARGISVLDLETRTFEFIRNPYSIFNVYRYDDVHALEQIEKDLESGDFSRFKDNYVKILVENKEKPYTFDQILDKIYEVGPVDLKISDNMNYLVDDLEDVEEMENTTDLMNKYVDGLGLDKGKTKSVKGLMNELYQEAISLENIE